ncbi:MAG: formyltransferase family protein, partial [Alphaproteobacteria bacterium]|nr:formyltransferase family protein [Alphaproteobacteria bacterium]
MKKLKVAVAISGSGSNLQAIIDACKDPSYPAEIVFVVSNKADAYGLKRAQEAGIPNLAIPHADYADRDSFDQAMHKAIVESGANFVVLAGF